MPIIKDQNTHYRKVQTSNRENFSELNDTDSGAVSSVRDRYRYNPQGRQKWLSAVVWHRPYRGGGTGPADPAAAGPIIYSELTTKDGHHNLTEEL